MQAIKLALHVSFIVEYSGLISFPLHTSIKKERHGVGGRQHILVDINVSGKEKDMFTIVTDLQNYRLCNCKSEFHLS
jgi:hypothetical protein